MGPSVRRILGDQDTITNYHLYGEIDLVTAIKKTRLRWAGHIAQMQENLPCRKITLGTLEGRRRVGRPNLGLME